MKELLHEVDRAIAGGQLTRNQLCMLLAALLAREAIVRGLLTDDEDGGDASSSPKQVRAPSLHPAGTRGGER